MRPSLLLGVLARKLPKKPYKLELRDARGQNLDASLVGMPADDDWVLNAAYNDRSLMRNALAYATHRDGRPRSSSVRTLVDGVDAGHRARMSWLDRTLSAAA